MPMGQMQPGAGTGARETAFKTSFMRGTPAGGRVGGASGHISTPGMRTSAGGAGSAARGHSQPGLGAAAQPAAPGPFDLSPTPAPLVTASAAPSDQMPYSSSLQMEPPATLRTAHPRSDSVRSVGGGASHAAQQRTMAPGSRQGAMAAHAAPLAGAAAAAPVTVPQSDPLLDFEPTPIDQIGQDYAGEDYSEFSSVLLVDQGRPTVRC